MRCARLECQHQRHIRHFFKAEAVRVFWLTGWPQRLGGRIGLVQQGIAQRTNTLLAEHP